MVWRCQTGAKLAGRLGGWMGVPQSSRGSVRFGGFELDAHAGELRRGGTKVRLQEQPFASLRLLLESPGEIITREELRQKIWPSDTFVDFDHGINNAIKRLREALGDTAETPLYIETLPRRGYRFLQRAEGSVQEASIAVLPFLSLSADPENEIFADGMCEEIICALMQIQSLHVVARTSSFAFKGKHLDLRVIGEQLKVRTLLEGSVRRSGNRLRITAQLVNAEDGYHLWSETYDREMQDVFAIQEDIAQSIARRLEVTLESGQQLHLKAGTDNLEAFKVYTTGRSLFFQRGIKLIASIDCLKRAVSLDSNYVLAWSALSDAYHMAAFYGVAKPQVCVPAAQEAALKAIALDPSSAEAHTSLAMSHVYGDWSRCKAEEEFLCSLRLKPHNSLVHSYYGLHYLQWIAGRFEEGLEQAKKAVQIDPLSAWARAIQSFTYLHIDADKALETARETLRIDPEYYIGWWAQVTALKHKGRFDEAAEVSQTALRISGRSAWVMASLADTYMHLGKRTTSESLYMELRWRSMREYVAPSVIAWAACAAGEQDEAIRYAREAHAIGDPSLTAAKYWIDFAELRKDPRFQAILTSRGWE